ncbi:MAG: DNA primase catalytic subunit PriS [Candidatus Thermoplasmatota archaeon]
MDEKSERYILKKFSEYYSKEKYPLPDRYGKREWGFMFFNREFMVRHIGFRKESEVRNYLIKNVPAHVYHSAAYYEKPQEEMKDKLWLGADLIFDIDADHIPGAKELRYEAMLDIVKEELKKLVFDFLLTDFGFSKEEIKIYFSGGRGYHVHVIDPDAILLGADERREIVDYITFNQPDLEKLIDWEVYDKNVGKKRYKLKFLRMPLPNENGWRGKIGREIRSYMLSLQKMDRALAMKELTKQKGIGLKKAEKILEAIKNFDVEKRKDIGEIIPNIIGHLGIKMSAETDEPVTSDIKRLIRMPYSLHGKTGFRVMPVQISEIDDFDPLRDAIVFSSEKLEIEIKRKVDIFLGGKKFELSEGKNKIEEFAAIFFILRDMGMVIE